MIPLSLYIHIPWCEKKCPYCDFNSHQAKETVNETDYIDALLVDLKSDLRQFKSALDGRVLQSIFIGGGTPSLFSADSIKSLLTGVADDIEFADNIEITLEANPGSSDVEKFSGFHDAGINRLSIGVQSFIAAHLTSLGRVHTTNDAVNAAQYARKAGFDNVNLDLMFGLPSQSIKQSLQDIQQAIDLAPTHLSCYQLTIEPNTLFHHRPPVRPDDEALWEMQSQLQSVLSANNYQQYEVSAYSKANKQCQHNTNYWQFGDYLGIGAGAHGKLTSNTGEVIRYWKIKHPTSYLNAVDSHEFNNHEFKGGVNSVARNQLPFEFMMNALRLTDGFDLNLFEERTHLDPDSLTQNIDKHQQDGLIEINDHVLKPTTRGQQMLDSLLQDYLV